MFENEPDQGNIVIFMNFDHLISIFVLYFCIPKILNYNVTYLEN